MSFPVGLTGMRGGTQVFTPWGLLAGLLFVLSTAHAFFAISKLGLSSASGIWCGTAVVVSFTFGVRVMGDTITRPAVAAPGLVLLITGLAGIAFNHQMVDARRRQQDSDRGTSPASTLWAGI